MQAITLTERWKRNMGRRKGLALRPSGPRGQFLIDPVSMPRNKSLDRRHCHPARHDDLYPPIEMNA